ncbi:MAG: hydroxymyristoyl-ACP dehydratase [Xanthomonadales bacterium]|nr:hydroxymyristoyl-ACP dehydratase [Xanthomonadales bacterium]
MTEPGNEWTENVCISATHPSLPGHFPGRPVVAGVILLDRLAALLEREGCGALRRISTVKFRSPLLPGEAAELQVALNGKQVRFRLTRNGEILTSGEAELA